MNNSISIQRAQIIKTVGALLLCVAGGSLFADVGSDNPTGTSGQFNGNVTTGCSYDAYTANATRSVTDLVVAGGVGSYPLAFTRTMNSRYTAGVGNSPAFGAAGTWTFSYQWTIDSVTVTSGYPTNYNVNYPDGRRITFKNFGTLPSGATDPDFRGPLGVRDRFEQLSSGKTECYVRLPDGGRVWFHANTMTGTGGTTYSFVLKGIIDPYGQTTNVSNSGSTLTVTEPAGRSLQVVTRGITSTTEGVVGDVVVDHVTGSDGRSVYYYYGAYTTGNGTHYTSLTSVRYFGDPTLDATYTYQDNNLGASGRPLIKTCIDTMFDGPMWKIAYDFQPAGTNADGSSVVSGQILRETHPNGTSVSRLTINAKTSQGYASRTDTRGDNPTGSGNPSRTFTYNGYKLATSTDFKNVATSQGYNGNNWLNSVTDRRGNATTFSPNQINGIQQSISYPGLSTQNYDFGGQSCPDPNNTDQYNKYWLWKGPDLTEYWRDTRKQVTEIDYAGDLSGLSDHYVYNNFGQVTQHTLKDNSIESWQYDTAGRVTAYWDAVHPTSGHPTAWYQYDAFGRVSGITEARGSASGDSNYTTTFQYNTRGQLTRLTHPGGTYIQYAYNPNATLAWTADERHPGAISDATQRTSYTYDDHKRPRSVMTPLRASGDSTPRITTYYYDQSGGGEDYTRTAAVSTKVVSPGGKVVATAYDENLRTVSVTMIGDSNVPSATTSYTYDSNGNGLTVKDPNGQNSGAITTYTYNARNQVSSMTDPVPANRNSSGHTMDYTYDDSGNLATETRADGNSCSYTYGTTGVLAKKHGYNGEVVTYGYQPVSNELTQYSFQKQGLVCSGNTCWYNYINYNYGRDSLGRLTSTTYPADASGAVRSESYHYDVANHLDQYTNPAGQVKSLTYDNRGRLTTTSWNSSGPSVSIGYDATRPTSITNTQGGVTSTIGFGYDEANNRIYEDQTISGLPTRRVQTDADADGNRTDLLVKTGNTVNFATYFDYTSRNELLNIYDSGHTAFFKYSYDPAGNLTQRLGQRLHDSTVFTYDAINRPITCAQNGSNGANFATSHYDYDKLGNLQDTYRDEEGGKGERFGYDPLNQVSSVVYSATNVTSSSPTNPAKSVSYSVSNRNRKTMTVTDNSVSPSVTTTTTYNNVDLNQISSIQVNGNPAQTVSWDSNMNLNGYSGWGYSYDAENRLISVSGNGHYASFIYDGVGRCVKRSIDGATTVFTFDQWTPVMEWDGSGNWLATNIYGLGDDELVYRLVGSWYYFVKSDPMGNVKFLLDAYGNGIEKYKYDAFGQPTITDWSGNARANSAFGNRFMFSGRDYMSSLALDDMRNRIYDPGMGRFYQLIQSVSTVTR